MSIKNYWIVTYSGEGLALGKRLKDEGMNVTAVFIQDSKDTFTKDEKPHPETPETKKKRLSLFDGLLDKMTGDEALQKLSKVSTPDDHFIFNDFNHNFKLSEQLSTLGIPGNFPTEADRTLEIDRKLGQDFVKKYYPNLKILEVQKFKTIDDGIKFLESSNDAWVLKGNDEDAKTRVPNTDDSDFANNQLMGILTENKKMYEQSGFILQKKIKNVIEATPEAIFYDGKLLAVTCDLELKRKGSQDSGRLEGCAADLVFEIDRDCPLAKMALSEKVFEMAKKHKGLFIWDASILFDPKTGDSYFGEFCSNRPGYNALYTEMALMDYGKKHIFFDDLVAGKNPYKRKVGEFAASVRLFNENSEDGNPMDGLTISFSEEAGNDLWLIDAIKKDEDIKTAGFLFDVGIVTGYGDTIRQAATMAYSYEDEVNFIDKDRRPLRDYLAKDYKGAILNRYNYLVKRRLI